MLGFNEIVLGIIVLNVINGKNSIWLPRAEIANFLIEKRDSQADTLSEKAKDVLDLDDLGIQEAVRSAIIYLTCEAEDSHSLVCSTTAKNRKFFIRKSEAMTRRDLLKETLTNQDFKTIQYLAKEYAERAAVRRNG